MYITGRSPEKNFRTRLRSCSFHRTPHMIRCWILPAADIWAPSKFRRSIRTCRSTTPPEVLEKGAGHLAGSSLPVGGETTHCVITAHRGLPSAKLFTDLDRIKEGDVFYLHVLGETLAYEVDQIKTVEPDQTDDLSIVAGKDYCTLVTCTPYAVNTHRLLVRGYRIPYVEEEYQEQLKASAAPSGISVLIRILCVIAGVAIALLIIWIITRREKRRNKEIEENAPNKGEPS